jgi:hypothetical protein
MDERFFEDVAEVGTWWVSRGRGASGRDSSRPYERGAGPALDEVAGAA